jgi:hypothetical protein
MFAEGDTAASAYLRKSGLIGVCSSGLTLHESGSLTSLFFEELRLYLLLLVVDPPALLIEF